MKARAISGASRLVRRLILASAWAAMPVLQTGSAYAHAFGERYDLPLPLALYLGGAAAAVVVSFLAFGLFVREAPWAQDHPRWNLLAHPLGRLAAHPVVVGGFKLVSVMLFVLVVAAGFFGNQDSFRNIAPVTVWILFWVGLAVVSAFVGDVWALVNPWGTLFAWAEALWRRLRPGRSLALGLPYPAALGAWPAVALLLAFAWSELISSRPAVPAYIATMALAYSLLTWTGMFLFGREPWLKHGEVFSVIFGVLARFAPTEFRTDRTEGGVRREWALRPPAVGLLGGEPASTAMAALVLLYLATVIYDGVMVTPAWADLESWVLTLLPVAGDTVRTAVRTVGLIGSWFIAGGLYLLACRIMAVLVAGPTNAGAMARHFVFTLVPIAIGYHLAHYLTYLLIYGQYAIPVVSDPFGRGWNLFGTAGYRIDMAVVGARFAWYSAVVAIVVAHVIAVFLAHAQAVTTFGARRPALRSQVPLTALMVAFTVASLTVLAEPIVSRAPAATEAATGAMSQMAAVPADSVLPEAGSGRLVPVGPGHTATTKLTYGAMASPFHDGTQMTAADLLYPFAVAWRWGAQPSAAGAAATYDPDIDRATALLRRSLVAVKFAGVDAGSKTIRFGDLTYARERLLVDVYVNAPAGAVETKAAVAPSWSPLPWHVIALLEEAVGRGWAAFSDAEAKRRGIPWLDPVRDEALKGRLKTLVEEFARDGYVPQPLAGLVTAPDARARWQALAAFHAKHGHFLVTNGPYTVKSWPKDAAVLEVVRDPRYPLGVGSYDSYAIPRRAFVTKTETAAGGIVLAVEVETVETVGRDYRIVRQPLQGGATGAGKRLIPECRYTVVGEDGRVALAGQGRLQNNGTFALDLKGQLAPGRYMVLVALYVNGNAINAEIKRIPYNAP